MPKETVLQYYINCFCAADIPVFSEIESHWYCDLVSGQCNCVSDSTSLL